MSFERHNPTKLMGALSPYEVYASQVEPYLEQLSQTIGTHEYFGYYGKYISEIESKREQYKQYLPAMLVGIAMVKIVHDYYESQGYKAEDTDGEILDDKFNIDLVATKKDEIIVAAIKAGEISNQEIDKFCEGAKKYILENHKNVKTKILAISAYKLNDYANNTFIKWGDQLLEEDLILERIFEDQIITKLPHYKKAFKDLEKIHQK